MPSNEPVVITRKQAKKQINCFGRSLFIYSLVFTFLRYFDFFAVDRFPEYFQGFDLDILRLVASMGFMVLIALIPFGITSKKLNLDIKDYWQDPGIDRDKKLSLICLGIGIQLITISISMLFYFFFHTNTVSYEFLGSFNTTTNIIKNALYFLFFVIIQPFFDEYIFRGIIQRQLGHYGRYFGALASATLYAIAQVNLVNAISSFFVGWYLSLITLRYHSIKPGVLVHMSIAAFIFLIDVIPPQYIWIVSIIIAFIYTVAAFTIFQKRVNTHMVKSKAFNGKLFGLLFSSSSIVLTLILFLVNVFFSFQ